MIQPFSVLWAILAMQNDDWKDNGEADVRMKDEA